MLTSFYVDEVFLTARSRDVLGDAKASMRSSVLKSFVKQVVARVHDAVGTFSCFTTRGAWRRTDHRDPDARGAGLTPSRSWDRSLVRIRAQVSHCYPVGILLVSGSCQ